MRQQSRRRHLVTLGRAAVTPRVIDPSGPASGPERSASFEHEALGPAREQLAGIEDERSQHAGHVIAADAELTRVRRERDARASKYATDTTALDGELASLGKKLEPLHKEAAGVRRRATDLHDALRRIDARIAATEASLDPAKPSKRDRAEIQAEIATLRADRKAIQSDEPVLAGQLDALNPRIAALEAARAEAQRKRAELDTAELDDQRRAEELLTAIGAKRKVVDRAAADAENRRDKILFQLGERLYVDRPDDLAGELAPIDEIDLEVGSADRRMMELREILTSVDRWKLVRGIALLVVVLAALGALAYGIVAFAI
jgi:chromosome segregation ATPase